MELSDFTANVSLVIRRGTAFDAQILNATRRALRWLERNYNFKHMERYVEFTLNPDAVEPRAIAFPSTGIKRIEFMKAINADGTLDEIMQIDPQDYVAAETGVPTGYWLDGRSFLWFNKTVTESLTCVMTYYRYTEWSAADNFEPWLLQEADDLVLWQTILELSPSLRDRDMEARALERRNSALKSVLDADEELRSGNTSGNSVMRFG